MTIRTITLAVALIFSAMAARAEIVEIDVPDSTERLLMAVPDGWAEVHSKRTRSQVIIEYVPEGQSRYDWDEMITVTVLRTAKPQKTGAAEGFAMLLAVSFQSSFCAKLYGEPTLKKGVRNNFPVAVVHANCFVNPKAWMTLPDVYLRAFEALGGIVIHGDDGIYQVQRAWHTEEFKLDQNDNFIAQGEVVDRVAKANDAIHDFTTAGVTACDTADPEKPCKLPTAQ